MGAETFVQLATGANAQAAFEAAQKEARYDYGHAGYTGTIAEKHDFIMLMPSAEKLARMKAKPYSFDWNSDDGDWDLVDDKWGPAGCYDLGDGHFIFFGWASS